MASIGFLGAGQMAEAMAVGFIRRGGVAKEKIHFCDPAPARVQVFKALGATPCENGASVAAASRLLFVAVKPQYVTTVLTEIRPVLTPEHVVVSIAAGITLQQLVTILGDGSKVIRVMPNTPCLVAETAAAMCLGGKATAEDGETVRALFSSVGRIFLLDEQYFSAVTALSGAGPAYVFLMIEALSDGGVLAGLPRDVALQLAAQTVMGSAKMLLETGKHPGVLKDMVTSPGGVTIEGVKQLEERGFRGAAIHAVYAAYRKAEEMSKSRSS